VPELPWLTHDLPGTGGRLKVAVDDFFVEELPAYAPSGEGHHVFVTIEKRDLTTDEAVRRLARALDVDARGIGTAGRKDRRAVTRQVVSIEGVDPARVLAAEVAGVRVVEAVRHGHKLRMGHLAGNRFRVRVRDVVEDAAARAQAVLDRLRAQGVPNFFGAQRFGQDGDNARQVRERLERRDGAAALRRMGRHGRFLVSALQSELFNDYVTRRLRAGTWARALAGDVMRRRERGGLFVCRDPAADDPRVAAGEIDPTGPIFGGRMMPAEDDAAALEEAVLTASGLAPDTFTRLGKLAPGTRRVIRFPLCDAELRADAEGLELAFTLGPGCYATVVLREVTKGADDIDDPGIA
jgi:tRNA pseudouridine13 synthase